MRQEFLDRLLENEVERADASLKDLAADIKAAAVKQRASSEMEKVAKNLSATKGAHGASLEWAPTYKLELHVSSIWEQT